MERVGEAVERFGLAGIFGLGIVGLALWHPLAVIALVLFVAYALLVWV